MPEDSSSENLTVAPPRGWRREIILFFTAVMFFTRLPVPASLPYSKTYLNRSARYFPLVGIVVGAIGGLTVWLAGLVFPLTIAILLSMIATIVATGAFHEDGFADVCDGFGGGYTKARVLEIMKDSRLGTFGVVGIGLMLALKFFALHNIDPAQLPWVLIAGHSLSRVASVALIYTMVYVREDALSKAKPLATKMSPVELSLAGILGILPFLFLGYWFLLTLIPVAIITGLTGRYFFRRIGGYTGDCLGAVQQLAEVVFYLSAIVIR